MVEYLLSNQGCLHQLYEDRVLQYPNNTAIIYQDQHLSYLALNQQANQLAHFILSHVKAGAFIGLFVERSIEMAIGYLAILKSGCIVVPLDTNDLSERQHLILDDANVAFILSQQHFAMHFSQAEIKATAIYMDHPLVSTYSTNNIPFKGHLNSLAIVIYTSGSTGRPKGVMISHANLNHYVKALTNNFNISKSDVYLHRGSVALIVSARQLLVPLTVGATVVIATKNEIQDPIALLKIIKAQHVTIFDHVPSFWKSLAKLVSNMTQKEKEALFDLNVRLVAVGGEAVTRDIVHFLFSHFRTNTVFKNMYGQTEATGVVTSYKITQHDLNESDNIAIGQALDQVKTYILDANLSPVSGNESGEICIAGDGVTMGYLNQPALTNEKFVMMPTNHQTSQPIRVYRTGDRGCYRGDGHLLFLWRIDQQVKINGHRIELNEIQTTLCLHPRIQEAQVIATQDKKGLLAFLIPSSEASPDLKDVRQFLLDKLPKHLLPLKFFILQAFPLTSSGKIDSTALLSHHDTAYTLLKEKVVTPPKDHLVPLLTKIWEEVLETSNISTTDNFFNLGGDSLKAAQLVFAIQKTIGYSIPIETIEQFSTIALMVDAINATKSNTNQAFHQHLTPQQLNTFQSILLNAEIPRLHSTSLLLTLNKNSQKPPLFWCFNSIKKEMSTLAKHLPSDQPIYGLLSSVPLDKNPNTLLQVANHYVDELLTLYPKGPFILGGNCRGAKVICEMYHLLRQKNIPIHKICLLEFFHPWLYQFEGDLMLLFGKHSHLKRHQLLKWDEDDWQKPFKKMPEVHWLNCAHGVFFNNENINSLADRVKQLIDC